MKVKEEGFVLSNIEYREKDAMIRFLGKDTGLKTFVIRGYNSPSSKQVALGLEYSLVEYYYNEREGLQSLIHGQLMNSYREYRKDFDWLIKLAFTSEIITKFGSDLASEVLFNFYSEITISTNYNVVMELLLYIINKLGIFPYLKGCVRCNESVIGSFSISEGGFLCPEHSLKKETYNYLVDIGLLFNKKWEKLSTDRTQMYINILCDYLEYHTDTKIHSRKLMNHV